MIIDQIRKSMGIYIDQNPYTIIVQVRSKVDNGFDKQVPDLTATPVATTLGIGRIARRRLPEPILANAGTPYDYQDVYYMLVKYDVTWLKKGLVFEYYGSKYRTGKVEKRIIFAGQADPDDPYAGIAYRLCNLEETTSKDIGDFYA